MKRRKRALAILALALVALAPAVPVRAQTGTPPDTHSDPARALYSAGASAYAAGNFAAAVQALGQAYALSQRPGILFSLAQAERQLYTLGHDPAVLRDAIGHYRAYVDETPQGGRRADAVEALGNLEVEVAGLGRALDKPSSEALRTEGVRVPTRIMVSVDVKDATVTIDGIEAHESPAIEETSPGAHAISTRALGYFDDTRSVTAVAGSLVVTEVTLREKPARVRLVVPAGADVTLDGRPHGAAPIADLEIPAGTHVMSLSQSGHRPELRTFSVERGGSLSLTANLPLTTQRKVAYGLFAGGAASLVGGGAAAVVALVLEGNAKSIQGDASRGNITASQLDSYNRALDQRDEWRTAAAVSAGVGALVVAAATILYATDHEHAEAELPKTAAKPPSVRPGGEGIIVSF